MMFAFFVLGLLLFAAWATHIATRVQQQPTRNRGPHALPNGYMDPQRMVWQLAAETGRTFHNIFLERTAREDLLDRRVVELEDELALRREAESLVLGDTDEPVGLGTLTGPPFKPDEPQTLAEYGGQPHITVPLEKAIAALPSERLVIDHKLFTGLAGLGKTLLAKVTGNTLHLRAQSLGHAGVPFFWTFAANLHSADLLDAFARQLERSNGGVWFIDEIHVLDKALQTKIYSLMEDGLYPYEGATNPTPIPNVMVIGATTDYGGLHPALKRRFGEPMLLRRIPRAAIAKLMFGRSFPIQEGAAELLAERTYRSGAPWEALMLRREAEIFAKAAGRTLITEQDVQDVFDVYDIDVLGLRFEDREVIRVLFNRPRTRGKDNTFVCFGASESDICAVAGLDPVEYRETIKPRLLSRGLVEVRSGYGQALTELAVTEYRHLKV